MAIESLEVAFATPERVGAPGQMKKEVTFRFDPNLVSTADIETLARKSVGKDIQAPANLTYVVQGYRLFGDNVTLIMARDDDQVIAERKRMERKRMEALEAEVMEGLNFLLANNDTASFSKVLQRETVAQKALSHFQAL